MSGGYPAIDTPKPATGGPSSIHTFHPQVQDAARSVTSSPIAAGSAGSPQSACTQYRSSRCFHASSPEADAIHDSLRSGSEQKEQTSRSLEAAGRVLHYIERICTASPPIYISDSSNPPSRSRAG